MANVSRESLFFVVFLFKVAYLFVFLKGRAETPLKPTELPNEERLASRKNTFDTVNGVHNVNNASKAEVNLILLTYVRSGSSFTGDLLNHHPEVFYVYEPLYPVKWYFSRGEPASFLHRPPLSSREVSPEHLKQTVVRDFLNCDMQSLYLRSLTHFGLQFGIKTNPYATCLRHRPGTSPVPDVIRRCLPLLQSACVTLRVKVLKVVRLDMQSVQDLLKVDPKVKVVHLVRDPRPVLRSQRSKGMFRTQDLAKVSGQFCKQVLRDLDEAEKLKIAHPRHVMTARYEDLANEPIRFAEKLLAFADLRTDVQLRQYIWNLTSAGIPDNVLSFNQRQSSRQTANYWRETLEFSSASVIDENCWEVYKRIGYLPFSTEESLRNLTVRSYLDMKNSITRLW
ncbi:hypothetical protein V1264_008268 [Littorina saxatilis]|uniref:Sulfotransferase n=1 Tax=Littorina saxatilis TaxID=31220 RepID=A0AAN9G2P1_9CAEN